MKKPALREESYSKTIQDMALRIALHCVRNTIIEDYHAQGKISDQEMKAFNIEVVNNIFTFFELMSNSKFQKERDFVFGKESRWFYKPTNWNAPELDERRINGIHDAMEREASEKKSLKGLFG